MNRSPFVIQWWKELRAVLPVWAAVMFGLGCLSFLYPSTGGHDEIRFVVFVIGSAIVCSFACIREFEDRTIMLQFSQPQDKLWVLRRKVLIVTLLQFVFFAGYVFLAGGNARNLDTAFRPGGCVSVLAVFSCLMWGTILRNTLSAVVVSLLSGTLIMFGLASQIVEWLVKIYGAPNGEVFVLEVVLGLTGVYAICSAGLAVYFWGRLQMTGEQTPASGLDVRMTSRFLGHTAFQKIPAWLAMVRKDIGLVRYLFWIGGLFVATAVCFIAADTVMQRAIHDAETALSGLTLGTYEYNESQITYGSLVWWRSALDAIGSALFVLQLALVPLLGGALVFTEETQIGNRAWQLCQPMRSLHQCLLKFATGLGVSFLIGLLIPVAVAYASVRTGEMVGPGFERGAISQAVTLHLLLFSVAAWCATWSRTTVTTVMKTFLAILGFNLITTHLALVVDVRLSSMFGYQHSVYNFVEQDWRITAGMLILLATAATLFNFRSADMPTRRWLGQGAVFAVSEFMLALALFRLG